MATQRVFQPPEYVQEAVQSLTGFTAEEMDVFLQAVSAVPPTSALADFAEHAAEQAKMDSDVVLNVLSTVIPLVSLLDRDGATAESVIDNLREAFEPLLDPPSDAQKWELLRARLISLIEAEGAVSLFAKIGPLLAEHQHVYQSSRIITDVRPIFDRQPDTKPVAALIVHELRITYLRAGNPEDLYVAMDDRAIADLKRAISRAEDKSRVLKPMIEALSLPIVGAASE